MSFGMHLCSRSFRSLFERKNPPALNCSFRTGESSGGWLLLILCPILIVACATAYLTRCGKTVVKGSCAGNRSPSRLLRLRHGCCGCIRLRRTYIGNPIKCDWRVDCRHSQAVGAVCLDDSRLAIFAEYEHRRRYNLKRNCERSPRGLRCGRYGPSDQQ